MHFRYFPNKLGEIQTESRPTPRTEELTLSTKTFRRLRERILREKKVLFKIVSSLKYHEVKNRF